VSPSNFSYAKGFDFELDLEDKTEPLREQVERALHQLIHHKDKISAIKKITSKFKTLKKLNLLKWELK